MLRHEEIVKKFSWGISILTAYLHYNNKINYTDINILSEGFVRDLLNILFDLRVNIPKKQNSPGYDLISVQKKIIIQVSTTCTSQKVIHSFNSLKNTIFENLKKRRELEQRLKNIDSKKSHFGEEDKKKEKERIQQEIANIIDIRGYRVIFFFLKENADEVVNYGKRDNISFDVPTELRFCQESDVLCFGSLLKTVNDLSEDLESKKIDGLEKFMIRNSNLFIRRKDIQPSFNKVYQIINEYKKNFCDPLFLHRYQHNTHVTLKNMFVEPSFSDVNTRLIQCPNNIIELIDAFVWDCDKDRLLFIDGDAAIGKTSLISWLCYHYTELDDIGKSIFVDLQLVCIRLRDLSLAKSDLVESCILGYLEIKDMDEFEEQFSNALIVLEGADELGLIGGIGALTIEQFILDIRHVFSKHKIIITSRPKFINMEEFSGTTQIFSYQHYSLNHFSKEKRNCWICNYENEDKCGEIIPESTKKYLSELSDEEAAGVADTPLALYLLVACEITETLRNNKWALYREIFHNAIRNTPYNESFKKGRNTQYHQALQDNDFAETVYYIIGKISNKMFENFKEERFYIYSNELDNIILKLFDDDKLKKTKAIRKCCVLCAYWKENTDVGALEFYHNNIRDFFMCEYIYQCFFGKTYPKRKDDIIKQLIETACEIFQYGSIAKTTWSQAFSFLFFRLKYEKSNVRSNERVENGLHIAELFPFIIYALVNSDTMWKYPFNGARYDSIKSTFLNFVLFLRIWIAAETDELLEAFSMEMYYDFWHGKGIFEDWIEVFCDNIEISQNKYIGFGTQMKFSNMDFKQAKLGSACFEESKFTDSTFENADLSYANYSKAHLERVKFRGSDLHNVDFSNAILEEVDFTDANLLMQNL